MKKILLMICLTPALAASQIDGGLSFEPAHAAEQQQMTSLSLQSEFDQFRALSDVETKKTEYQMAKRKFAQATLKLERAQSLVDSKFIPESAFAMAYYNYRELEADVIRLPVEIAKAKLTAEFHKLRVLELGNPGKNYQAELIETMINGVDSELQTLATSLNLAGIARNLAEKYWKNGQVLARSNFLPKERQELREMEYRNSVTRVEGLQRQIELVKLARASLEASQKRQRNNDIH